ncbi:hypothetical protein DSO57_1010365 [Entomophthora muscae]|uniref:Uncharacterized protein n=1 Tax=Entomophthora muscae TaxID=34485 RepID=A0ACC2URI5_9FUNG|nr:hypothetical protein DSO57_1010365 [Entomophthora muscae]
MKYPSFDIAIRLIHNVRYVKGQLIELPLCIEDGGEYFFTVINFVHQNKGLSASQKEKLSAFMLKFKDLFHNEGDPLPPANLEKHVIETGTVKPICKVPYHLTKKYDKYVEQEIDCLLSKGIIEMFT